MTEESRPEAAPAPDTASSPDTAPPAEPAPRRSDRRRTGDGLASLVGSGSSQVGTNGAMRARDVSRPR